MKEEITSGAYLMEQTSHSGPLFQQLRPTSPFMKEVISTLRSTSKVVSRSHDTAVQRVTNFIDHVRPPTIVSHYDLDASSPSGYQKSQVDGESEESTGEESQMDGAPKTEESCCRSMASSNSEVKKSRYKMAREAGVAVVGGGLIAVGIPLIPLPGPGDFMVVGGLALLATEFPAAQRILDGTRDKLEEVLDNSKERHNAKEKSNMKEQHEKTLSTKQQQDGDDDSRRAVKDAKVVFEEATAAVQNQAEAIGRNVVLPMLDHVCTTPRGSDQGDGNSVALDR